MYRVRQKSGNVGRVEFGLPPPAPVRIMAALAVKLVRIFARQRLKKTGVLENQRRPGTTAGLPVRKPRDLLLMLCPRDSSRALAVGCPSKRPLDTNRTKVFVWLSGPRRCLKPHGEWSGNKKGRQCWRPVGKCAPRFMPCAVLVAFPARLAPTAPVMPSAQAIIAKRFAALWSSCSQIP
jgi:hypothetical protein